MPNAIDTLQRRAFRHDGLTLSYLDAGGDGRPLIALHAHWLEGATYAPLAAALAPRWRVIAPDQRGHGYSDHASRDGGYARDAYIGDVSALMTHLGIATAVVLGNSLGGVNAYQLAARHPERVRALIIEDIGPVSDDEAPIASWAGTFPSRAALAERVGAQYVRSVATSFRETADGWRLAFDPRDMIASQHELNGDYWSDWLASDCPALVIHGRESRVTTAAEMDEMVARRPHTQLVTIDGGHNVHVDNPNGFLETVQAFLRAFERA